MLKGNRIWLRPLEKKDLDYYRVWIADPDLARLTLGVAVSSPEEQVAKVWRDQSSEHDILFTIETLSREPIGFCFLRNAHPVHRFVELEQFFIGPKDERGCGHGEDAIRTLIWHCFFDLGLNRIWLITYAYNLAAIQLYEKCGFLKEGHLRQIQFTGRGFYDGIMMAILRWDWVTTYERY